MFNSDQLLTLLDDILKQAQAEGTTIRLSSEESGLTRFSENQITQNLLRNSFKLNITSHYGKKQASASLTSDDFEEIIATLRKSEALARLAPDDPEAMPLLPPQVYHDHRPAFDLATANYPPLQRGKLVKQMIDRAVHSQVNSYGTLETVAQFSALVNSLGLKAWEQTTTADISFTAKIENGSSWGKATAFQVADLPVLPLTERIIETACLSRSPREFPPTNYPVILTAEAFGSLLPWLVWNLDARSADEGRSFMSKETGGNCLGEALFSPLVQVDRNPTHPLLQLGNFCYNGLSNHPLTIIQQGIPQVLSYSRYWAQQQNQQPTGELFPIVMEGHTHNSLSELIKDTEKAILIHRAWYVRYVNPKPLEVTGMTRDGTFLVENGQISYPIRNLRFNQSLPHLFRDIDAVTPGVRLGSNVIPHVRVKGFNFTSITDSI